MNFHNSNFRTVFPRYRQVLSSWIESKKPALSLTLTFNDSDYSDERIRRAMKRYYNWVDKKIHGRRSLRFLTIDRRTFFFAFPEKERVNPHLHLLVTPTDGLIDKYVHRAPGQWKRIAPKGTINIDRLTSDEKIRAATRYSSKECWKENYAGKFIISHEFFPNQK